MIVAHSPADAEEEASRETILAFLDSGGNVFDRRRYAPGHLTGSAFILDASGKNLLLVHHARLDRWLQPGGHGEPGETDPYAVAIREAQEETGITGLQSCLSTDGGTGRRGDGAMRPFDLDVHAIPARKNEPAHLHLDIRYLFVTPAGIRPAASAESRGIAWKPLLSLLNFSTDASIRRTVSKIRAFIE